MLDMYHGKYKKYIRNFCRETTFKGVAWKAEEDMVE
jgi:hypothetical protein